MSRWTNSGRSIRRALALILALPIGLAWAAAAWRMDPAESRLGFAGTQAGSPFEGTFARFTVDLHFDPADLAGSKAIVIIDMTSARTGSAERDGALQGQDWFATAGWPEARFETRAFRPLDDERWEADATLTMRGVARPVVLAFTLQPGEAGARRARGELVVDRTDYGIGQGQWASGQWVGKEVTIRFDLRAAPQP